ncbi:MAG TPA: hypothetical protein VEZ11_08825 [Thermoanaerobaculia bacterium]|nr:hypothetical protein [Thermoanaerobaculia bacterium]
MRTYAVALSIAIFSLPLIAQPTRPPRVVDRQAQTRILQGTSGTAETAIKQAMQQLATAKQKYDKDLEVLRHLRAADGALIDPTQPHNAIQKAFEEVSIAKQINPDFDILQGVITIEKALESARLSPAAADFGRLRAMMYSEAIAPAVRVVARDGAWLQEETLAWIKVQELISMHLHAVAEISAECLRVAQQ